MEIFQRNDIRGIFGTDLRPEDAYRIGLCLPGLMNARNILVCRDMRLSSEELFNALTAGITDAGCGVTDIGEQETPAFYFAVGKYEAEGGVMITASHNPGNYNGFKIVGPKAHPIDSENGFKELKARSRRADLPLGTPGFGGDVAVRHIGKDYLDFLRGFMHGLGRKKIVIDCSHGMAGRVAGEVFRNTDIETVLLNARPDGTFPVHGPNPMKNENLVFLREAVRQQKADLGICFDGDGDRVVFVDAEGNSVSPDIVTALLAGYLLQHREQAGEVVLYDLRSSMKVPEFIEKRGGRAVMSPIGHSRIKRMMRRKNAMFGGELTGHYYFRENNYCDSGWISIFYLLALMEAEGKDLVRLTDDVGGYYFSGEINYTVKDKKAVLASLAERFHDGTQSRLDGLRVEFPNWWFIVRESTTEPYLRLVVEAKKPEVMETRRREIEDLIMTVGSKVNSGRTM